MDSDLIADVNQDGLWGFTGNDEIDIDDGKVIKYKTVSYKHVNTFVLQHWPENQWETAWFLNPPVSELSIHSAP